MDKINPTGFQQTCRFQVFVSVINIFFAVCMVTHFNRLSILVWKSEKVHYTAKIQKLSKYFWSGRFEETKLQVTF